MRIPYFAFGMISLFLFAPHNFAEAKSRLNLLELPSKQSTRASESVMMAMTPIDNAILAVGERGHIVNWQNTSDWQQQSSPVSVTITDLTLLSDGSKIAVGHDGVILKAESNSNHWHKVFTGDTLTTLKISLLTEQLEDLQRTIALTQDEDELEELEYQRDDLTFAIEDSQLELQDGPNKPLLSITQTSNDTLFASGAYGTLLTSKDKGESWRLISNKLDNPDGFHLNAITVTGDNKLYIIGENGLGFQSDNLGQTWSTMTLPYSGSLFGIIANPAIPSQLVAFGLQGNFMVSLDSGAHWQHKKLPTSASLLGGHFSEQGDVYLVGHGGLIINFKPEELASLTIEKHHSGAALASVVVKENALILAGQFGILTWPLKK